MAFGDLIQSAGTAASSAAVRTLTITVSADTTAGNSLTLTLAASNVRLLTGVADSKGNTWTVAVTRGNENGVGIAYCVLGRALVIGDTITATLDSAGYSAIAVNEWEGRFLLDGTASAIGVETVAGDTGATPSTTSDGEIAIGAFAISGLRSMAPSDPSWRALTIASSTGFVRTTYSWCLRARAGPQQLTGTWNSASTWSAAIATFMSADAVPAAGRMLGMVI